MKVKIFIFALVLPLFACQPIMKKIYGIKNPGIENEHSILKKAKKYKFDATSIATINSKDFLCELSGKGIPDGSVYDKDGKYIEYRQTDTSCNAGLFEFIPSLNSHEKYNQPDSVASLNLELKNLRDLKGNQFVLPESADFYLLIYWTVWTGRLNKNHVKIWSDLASKNKNAKIKVIFVNLDLQEYWGVAELDRIVKLMEKSMK